MRQLPPTGRLRFRAIFSTRDIKRIAQRLVDEWLTDTPRFYHLLQEPVAQRVSHVPSDANQDDVDRETHFVEAKYDKSCGVSGGKVYTIPTMAPLMRPNPR